jgi:phosphoribosylformimino-5-aminoimidazole carboxamide ribotide isomerase
MLTKVRVPLQIGGGLREDATIGLLLGEGARRAIVGTRALGDPQWLEAVATAHPGRIMVALDVLKGKAMVEGWRKEALRRPQEILPSLDPLPLAGILYTNLEVEGKRQGMDVAAVEQVMGATSHKVVVSGGVSTRRDLEELESVGVEEVVVGSALYRGDLPPEVVA